MTALQRLLNRRDEESWVLPIDEQRQRQRDAVPESKLSVVSYALAAGVSATLLGALASVVVPGRAFLAVWALVTIAVSVAAGWEAARVRSALRRRLLHLLRAR